MANFKVKVSEGFTEKELAELKQKSINKAKAFLAAVPFSTPLYMAMKLKMPLDFIVNNREKIGI